MDEQEAGTERSQEEGAGETSASENRVERAEAAPTEDERDSQEGRSGDALAWLEGPAFSAPIEEMPTLQWPDVEAEAESANAEPGGLEPAPSAGDVEAEDGEPSQPPDDLADAMLWLETLAEKQGTPIEETPTLVSSGEDESDLAAAAAAAAGLQQIGDTTPPPMLDSDPMAWLEQLAIDQDSPLEELPSVADRLLASEIVSQIDADSNGEVPLEPLTSQPLELDDALLYLESQAAAQGISLDEVAFDEAEVVESVDDDLDALDKMAIVPLAVAIVKNESEPPVAESENDEWGDLSAQIPEDPDAALAWLGELSEEEEPSDSEKDRSAMKKGAAVAAAAKLAKSGDEKVSDEESTAEVIDADILEGMPDDPDEAMAWMVGLAAQNEGAVAGDKASVEADEEEQPDGIISGDKSPEKSEGITLARAALASGAVAAAATEYRKMLDSGQGGPELIGELETAVAEQPDQPELVQLLGDAYMEDGQLQKAKKAYSKGFDQS